MEPLGGKSETVASTAGKHEILTPDDALQDLCIQMQCFAHAPTRDAWSLIWELYTSGEVQQHSDFPRFKEKFSMFISLCLSQHEDWVTSDEQQKLFAQAKVRRDWLLSSNGDSQRKLDHIWHAYFATGEACFPQKIIAIANNVTAAGSLRETAVWSYGKICKECYPRLAEIDGASAILQTAAYLK